MTPSPTLSDEARALLFTEARTANAFTDEPVTDDQVAEIYELLKYAPTAVNSQPLRVLLVGQDQRDRLLKHMSDGNRDKTENAPLVAVLAADTEFHEHLGRTFPHAPGVKERYDGDADAREQAARFNANIQIGYFLLAVRAAGLAAGPMGGFDAVGLDEEFFDGTGWKSLLVVNLGRPGPDAWYDRLPRLELHEVVRSV